MTYSNRLILDEEQPLRLHLKGGKIVNAHTAGSFGFSTGEAEADVVELRHALDTSSEPVFITRALFIHLQAAFRQLALHRARAERAEKQNTDTQPK